MRPFRLNEGDLAVRKFYRAAVLKHTGTADGIGRHRRLEFTTESGATLWEYISHLRQRRLYAMIRVPNSDQARRRANAIAKVVAARLGRPIST